jgi:hypothetical protein
MKRKIYFLFLLLIKPSRLFRLSWRARLYKGWSGIHRLYWRYVENIHTDERKFTWVPDTDCRELPLSEYFRDMVDKTEREFIERLFEASPILKLLQFKTSDGLLSPYPPLADGSPSGGWSEVKCKIKFRKIAE